MPPETQDKHALVVDTGGLFLPLASKLSESFERVSYYSTWERSFPILNEGVIGDGFSDIERVESPFVVGDVDLAVFPDCAFSDLQLHFESLGIPVWGSRKADALELNRPFFLAKLEQLGLDVPPHQIVDGLSELRTVLADKQDCYVKVSKWRGSFETAHWRSMDLDEALLDVWAMRFGPAKDSVRFVICDAIDGVEIGADCFCVDGQWPSLMLHGVECKDQGYLASVTKRDDMPDDLRSVMDAFSPFLKETRYRNQWSMEMRGPYFIDATCRGGLPSSASQMELWSNFADIIWRGAHGELVEPEPLAQFSAECALHLKTERNAWGVIDLPKELAQWMKLASCCEIDGRVCFPPEPGGDDPTIGWLCAIGDSPREAIDTLKEHAAKLPDGVTAKLESLVDVVKTIEDEQEQGIEFTDRPMPEATVVLEDK